MGIFSVFKKKAEDAPPDIGKEVSEVTNDVAPDQPVGGAYDVPDDPPDQPEERNTRKAVGKGRSASASSSFDVESVNLGIERLSARIEALNSLSKGMNERFSGINQQIGELRAMNLANEKALTKVSTDSAKAIDVVAEVKPERIRFDFQKVEMKVEELSSKLESNGQFMETIMNELKDLRRKSGLFMGTDAIVKLNDDVKKDLIVVQQIAAKAKLHADKTEELFIEASKHSSETQKVLSIVNNLDTNYSGIKKEIERLKIDFSSMATKDDFLGLKKYFDTKSVIIDTAASAIDKMDTENHRLAKVLETTLGIVQQNKKEIADIAITVGDDHIQRISDYDDRLNSILRINDSLAGEIVKIKERIGMSTKKEKIEVKPAPAASRKEETPVLDNMDVHPEVMQPLEKEEPNEQITEIAEKADDTTQVNEIDELRKKLQSENSNLNYLQPIIQKYRKILKEKPRKRVVVKSRKPMKVVKSSKKKR